MTRFGSESRGLRAAFIVIAIVSTLAIGSPALAADGGDAPPSPAAEVLRVCADPSNMPFSNEQKQGFENKIAALLGDKLGVRVEYYWRPEQMGFGRGTLKRWIAEKNRYACDLVISAGSGFDVGKTTLPYYRSSYVLAYMAGKGLDDLRTPSDLLDMPEGQRDDLRIGVFTRSPVGDWLVMHGLGNQTVGYRAQSGGFGSDPADMVTKDLVNGKIDIATIWGPIGGYSAQKVGANIKIVPFTRDDGPNFDFPVSMAVRYGNDAWLATVQKLIEDNHDAILGILKDYGVPLVDLRPEDRVPEEDDDD